MSANKSIVTIILIVSSICYCINQTISNKVLCPHNSIDAITLFSNNTLLIFQKNHVWTKFVDSIETPKLIQNHWSGHYKPFQSDFDDVIYNPKEELTLIFKEKYFWLTFHSTSTNDRYLIQNITNYFETFHDKQTSIDAAILVEDINNDCSHYKCLILFLFKDKFLWSYKWYHFWHIKPLNEHPIDVTTINAKFPTQLDTAYSDKYYIYLIKGLYYYKILRKRFPHNVSYEDLTPHLLYVDIIKCKYDDSLNVRSNQLSDNQMSRSSKKNVRGVELNDEVETNELSDNTISKNIKKSVKKVELNGEILANESINKEKNISFPTPTVVIDSDYLNISKVELNGEVVSNVKEKNISMSTPLVIFNSDNLNILNISKVELINEFVTKEPNIKEKNISLSTTVAVIDSDNIIATMTINSNSTINSNVTHSTIDFNEVTIETTEPVTMKPLTTDETGVTMDSNIREMNNSTLISIREYLSTNNFEISDTSYDKLNLLAIITFIAILLIISLCLTICCIKFKTYRRSYDLRNN